MFDHPTVLAAPVPCGGAGPASYSGRADQSEHQAAPTPSGGASPTCYPACVDQSDQQVA